MTVYESDLPYDGSWTYEDLSTLQTTGSRCGNGWLFFVRDPAGGLVQINPTIDGEMSFESTRDVRRSISGQILLPSEVVKFNLNSDEMYAFLVLSGTLYQMGVFRVSEIVIQPDVILDPNNPTEVADLVHVSWADRMIRMRANDGSAQTIFFGADPSQEMALLLDAAGLPYSISGAVARIEAPITWDGGVTLYDKVSQLADLAGHRPPWPDNAGVIRSELGALDESQLIPLEELLPVAESITITENYLSAPNRVIVTDNSGSPYGITGQWDAPASAPHSFANRGWIQTEMVSIQGLSTSSHAEQIAATIGESYTGRRLSAILAVPTYRLDGPVFLRYADTNWIVQSWSVPLAPNEVMTVQAEEYFVGEIEQDIGRAAT